MVNVNFRLDKLPMPKILHGILVSAGVASCIRLKFSDAGWIYSVDGHQKLYAIISK